MTTRGVAMLEFTRRGNAMFESAQNAQSLCDSVFATAKGVFLRDGYHRPILFIVCAEQVYGLDMGSAFATEIEKDLASVIARSVCQAFGSQVQGTAFVSECWVRQDDGTGKIAAESEHCEALQVWSEWRGCRPCMRVLRILRDNGRKIASLVEFDRDREGVPAEVRFANFLASV